MRSSCSYYFIVLSAETEQEREIIEYQLQNNKLKNYTEQDRFRMKEGQGLRH